MEIKSITYGPSGRETRFELLRIIAMFMVLIVHADFYSLGSVGAEEFVSKPIVAWTRTILEFSAIIGVNLFIIISGWFHIKASLKGLCNFLFQCFFFLSAIFFSSIILGLTSFSVNGMIDNYLKSPMNWFILSYVILYFISPIINSYLRTACCKQILLLTIILTAADVFLGWTGIASFYIKGYSPLTFIELYMIGHVLRIYKSLIYRWGGYYRY